MSSNELFDLDFLLFLLDFGSRLSRVFVSRFFFGFVSTSMVSATELSDKIFLRSDDFRIFEGFFGGLGVCFLRSFFTIFEDSGVFGRGKPPNGG